MLTQRLANIVFAVLIVIACVYFAIVAEGFKAAGLLATSGVPSKFFPQLLLGCTALCAVIVIASYAMRGHAGGDQNETVFADAGEARRGPLMLLVSVVCYFIWSKFGFLPMAVVMGPLCLLAMGVRSLKLYFVVLVLTALIYVVFTQALGVQLK